MPTSNHTFIDSLPLWLLVLFWGLFIAGFLYQVIITIRIYYFKIPIKGKVVGFNTLIGIFTALPLAVIYHIDMMEQLSKDYYTNPLKGLEMIKEGLKYTSALLPIVGIGWMIMFQGFCQKILNKQFRLLNLLGMILITLSFFNMYFVSTPPIQPSVGGYHGLILILSVIIFIVGWGMLIALPGKRRDIGK